MKKPSAKPKKTARKAPTKKKRAGPLDKFFPPAEIEGLRRLLLADSFPTAERSVEDMIEVFLSADPTSLEEMPEPEAMSELGEELDRLRIDANGGDQEARETLQTVRETVDKAARKDEIHPGILILLGRVFAGAHVDVGAGARASMARMVAAGVFHEPGQESYQALVQPLLTSLEGDDFGLHEEIRCASDIFPSDYRSRLVESLAADSQDRARRSAVGFLLDPDDAIALAAVRGLAAGGALDATTRRRIGLIDPWLSAARREALDKAFPPVPADDDECAAATKAAVRTTASACDGSGAASLTATLKRGARHDVVLLMLKASGVAEAHMIERLSKTEASMMESDASASVPSAETTPETWLRLVRLALGRGLAGGASPPFEFVRAVEAIGFSSIVPDLATPAELIDSLIAGVADRDDPAVIADAQGSVADRAIAEDWFEAGEAVEDVLRPTESIHEGEQALIENYLPGRRAFWANQCALSALALSAGARPEDARDLALVGREILRATPLADIPLMRQIANTSARSFFAYRR